MSSPAESNVKIIQIIQTTFILPLGLLLMSGPFLIGYQLFFWLKEGEWNSFSILDVTEYMGVDITWKGLEKILDFFPLSAALGILAVVSCYLLFIFTDKLKN